MSEQKRAPETGGDASENGVNAGVNEATAEAEALATADQEITGDFAAEKQRLEAEIASMKDKFLRAFAEAENIRRRAEKEVVDAKTYGIASFARDVLNVADDLARALGTVDDEAKATADGAVKGLLEGLELTERGLVKALEKHGIRKIEPKGQKFDPNLHQAMFEVPDPSVPSGTVVQVVQSGYVIGERVLRPAMVGVARGGPKAEAAASQTSDKDKEAGAA
ncbi:nucleotide exchange factor GrpE [Xanthobacter oligotrophicus]|uniref:nucleotide exchange factor GrpE n=1 Tax=Xanthobacter oligotrophicus TaxID=2607286 RepID=UPI0011F0DF33|nr:nucleotide exchange factor GrpE [Xanthobacter oligotrophicus]MCG5234478.1 nucleotide exchange factor GrpE [Xanthobacter oligotrophicus]